MLHGGPDGCLQLFNLFVGDGFHFARVVAARRGGGEETVVLVLVAIELAADGIAEARHDVVDIRVVVATLSG